MPRTQAKQISFLYSSKER